MSELNLTIVFGKSNSPNYAKAVAIAERCKFYEQSSKDKKIEHRVRFDPSSPKEFSRLCFLTENWQSSYLLLNDKVADNYQMSWLNCYVEAVKSEEGKKWCEIQNEFGCTNIERKKTYVNKESYDNWDGYVNDKGLWIIDDLNEQIDCVKHCPYFTKEKEGSIRQKLPPIVYINPLKDKNWAYCDDDHGRWVLHKDKWYTDNQDSTTFPGFNKFVGLEKIDNIEREIIIEGCDYEIPDEVIDEIANAIGVYKTPKNGNQKLELKITNKTSPKKAKKKRKKHTGCLWSVLIIIGFIILYIFL